MWWTLEGGETVAFVVAFAKCPGCVCAYMFILFYVCVFVPHSHVPAQVPAQLPVAFSMNGGVGLMCGVCVCGYVHANAC